MRRLIGRLDSATGSVWSYGLLMAVVATPIALAVAELSMAVLSVLHIDPTPFQRHLFKSNTIFNTVLIVALLVPALKTLLIAGTMALVKRRESRMPKIALVSAIVWGALHGMSSPLSFLPTTLLFFGFTYGYLLWRQKSFKLAYLAAFIPHVLNNSLVLVLSFIWP